MTKNSSNIEATGFASSKEARQMAGGVSPVTLWRWEKKGLFPEGIHLTTNSKIYRRSELDEWEADPVAWRTKYALEKVAS